MPALAPIGLDIGSVAIRAVEVARTKDRPVINNFGQVSLPEGAVVGGVVKDERAVTAALRTLWTAQHFKAKTVILGVSHQQVVVREVEIAKLPPKELKQALPFMVRDILPLPVDQAMLDFYPLDPDGTSTAKDMMRGLLIAAPKEAVINTVRAVESAGLHVEQIDLSCFAALRAVANSPTEAEAVVDLGANGTNIVIHCGGIPQIVRTIPRGGAEITKLLSSRLGVEPAEAERIKCVVGVGGSEARRDGEAEAREVIDEAVRPLINEIRSSLSYYTNGHQDRPVTRLALVGGASHLPGFTDALTASMGVPAHVADPLQYVEDSRHGGRHDVLGRYATSAAVSIGLTLGAA